MSDLDSALRALTVGATAAAFLVFVIRTGTRRQPGPATETDFGLVFGSFLAAWVATELLEFLAVPEIQQAGEALHFLLLATLAVWLNARFFTALRKAKEAE
jgi:hypothetical protein